MIDLDALREKAMANTPPTDYRSDIILVTPELARELLTLNKKNRNPKKESVELYYKEMMTDDWIFNGESIQININGELINGQHRLMALEKSGKSYYMNIVWNVPEEAYQTIDQQHTRSLADIFQMNQVKNPLLQSAILNKYILWSRKDGITDIKTSLRKSQIPKSDVLAKYFSDPEFFNEVHDKATKYYNHSKLLAPSEYGAYMCFLILYKNHHKAKVFSFFDQFAGCSDKSAIVITKLRDYFFRTKYNQHIPLTIAQKYGNVALTWNAYIQGKEKISSFPYIAQKGKEIPKFL